MAFIFPRKIASRLDDTLRSGMICAGDSVSSVPAERLVPLPGIAPWDRLCPTVGIDVGDRNGFLDVGPRRDDIGRKGIIPRSP